MIRCASLFRQPPAGGDRSQGAVRNRRGQLPYLLVPTVACRKKARCGRFHPVIGQEIPLLIPFRQCRGHFRIGNAAKGHEQPADREPRLPSVGIFQQKVFQLSVVGVEIGDDRIRQDGKIFPLGRLLHQCLLRPESISPVDQCHAAAASGQTIH